MNTLYWEERWHLQHNKFEFPVIGLVDYRRLDRSRKNGSAVREQRMLASEAIPWPVVDESGNSHAMNADSGVFEQTGIAPNAGRKEKVEHYAPEVIAAPISPKTLPTRFLRQGWPQPSVDVDYPFLYCKLQVWSVYQASDNERDGYVRAWVLNQLEVRHPFMYQAFLAEKWIFTVEDLRIEYGGKLGHPGWHWSSEWPEKKPE